MLSPDWPPIYIEAVSQRNTNAASAQLRHLGRNTVAIASSKSQGNSLKSFSKWQRRKSALGGHQARQMRSYTVAASLLA